MNYIEEYGKNTFKEDVTIFSSKSNFRSEDIPAIKEALIKGRERDVEILNYSLKKDLDDIRVYDVTYKYIDANTSKNKEK